MPVVRVVFEDVIVGVLEILLRTPPTTIEPLLNVPLFSTDNLIALGLIEIWSLVIPVRRVVAPGTAGEPGTSGVPENTSIDLPAAAVRVTAESSNVRLLAFSSSLLRF